MKRMKWIILTAGMLTGISCLAFEEGTDRGNGGDEYGKAFISYGLDIAESLALNPLPGVDTKELQAAIDSTRVSSEEQLELRGAEVDAINYPDAKKILVSRIGWDRMEANPHRRAFLVLHEYLGIMGVDDSRYQVSNRLDRADVCARTPLVRQAIEDQLQKSCYRIIQDDLKYVFKLGARGFGQTTLHKTDFAGMPRLDEIYFAETPIAPPAPDALSLLRNVREITFGNAITDLSDCRFLQGLPKLESVSFAYYSEKPVAVDRVQSGCFAHIPSLNRISLTLGKNLKVTGMFKGLENSPRFSQVSIFVDEATDFPAKELAPLSSTSFSYLQFVSKKGFGSGYLQEIRDALPDFDCPLSESVKTVSCQRRK